MNTPETPSPQPAQAPELVYSTNGEDWHLDDFSELIDELHSNGEGLDLVGMTYWVGEKRQRPASWYFSHNVEFLLDQARDQAWQDADEIADDFCNDVTDEAKAELDAAIKAWADKHVNVNFWTVHNIRTATLTPVRATGLPADAEPMRSRPERFKPNDGGTWIDDDDFGFDAMLKVDGDFGSDADRLAYAQFICDKLNAPEAIPAPEGAQGDEREECVSWLSGLYPDAWPRQDAEHAWDHGHVFSLAWKERGRRAALAAPAPKAPVALTDEQIAAGWKAWPEQSITSAAKAVRFVRSPGIPAPKEPTNDR